MRSKAVESATRLTSSMSTWPALALPSMIRSAIAIANWYFLEVAGISLSRARICTLKDESWWDTCSGMGGEFGVTWQ